LETQGQIFIDEMVWGFIVSADREFNLIFCSPLVENILQWSMDVENRSNDTPL